MQIVIAVCMLCIFLLPSVNGYLGIFENFPPLLNLLTQYGDSWWAKSILILDSRLFYLALLVFIIATASATQDVAIDATRIEMIKTEEPEKISAVQPWRHPVGGWALAAQSASPALCPVTTRSRNRQRLQSGYLALTVIVYFVYYGRYFFHSRPRRSLTPAADTRIHGAASGQAVCQSLMSFVRRYTLSLAILLLFFIFFFKIGEAFLGRMSLVFYKEVGFTKTEIGLLSGGLGTITVCVFSILGSFVNARYGLLKGFSWAVSPWPQPTFSWPHWPFGRAKNYLPSPLSPTNLPPPYPPLLLWPSSRNCVTGRIRRHNMRHWHPSAIFRARLWRRPVALLLTDWAAIGRFSLF